MAALVLLPGMDGTGALLSDLVEMLGAELQPIVIVSYPVDTPLGYFELEASLILPSIGKSTSFADCLPLLPQITPQGEPRKL